MPYPFGGHPTLGSYLLWAGQNNCEVQHGYMTTGAGKSVSLVRVTAPSGKFVTISGINQRDRLEPTKVAYLDRRLGLVSPWAAL